LAHQRQVVEAFLTASRQGDFDGLLAILDPDVVMRVDGAATPTGVPQEIRGAERIAKRGARGGAHATQTVLVDGAVGVVVAPQGKLVMVLAFTLAGEKITGIDAIADPERLGQLDLALLPT
jgi:RNA polymerase sigma-70 factor (ECF subfamily)